MKNNSIITKKIKLHNIVHKKKNNSYISLKIKFINFMKSNCKEKFLGFKVDKERIRDELIFFLHKKYKDFSKQLSCKITKFINYSVSVQCKEVKIEPLYAYLNNIPLNMTLNVVYIKELDKKLYTIFSTRILSLLIDNLFGNKKHLDFNDSKRLEMSSVSMYINEKLIRMIIDTYVNVWNNKYTFIHREFINNIKLTSLKDISVIHDMFIIVYLEIRTLFWKENIIISVPLSIVDNIRKKIVKNFSLQPVTSCLSGVELKNTDMIRYHCIDNLPLTLVVTLKKFNIPILELVKLTKGDVLLIEKPSTVLVNVEGLLISQGKYIINGTKKAVFIYDTIIKK